MHKRKEFSAFAMILQIGLNMIVPILGLTVFGAWLGETVGQNWVAIPFFVIGALAGGTSVYRLVKKFIKKSQDNQTEDSEGEDAEEIK